MAMSPDSELARIAAKAHNGDKRLRGRCSLHGAYSVPALRPNDLRRWRAQHANSLRLVIIRATSESNLASSSWERIQTVPSVSVLMRNGMTKPVDDGNL
jgi:hypothetical protein